MTVDLTDYEKEMLRVLEMKSVPYELRVYRGFLCVFVATDRRDVVVRMLYKAGLLAIPVGLNGLTVVDRVGNYIYSQGNRVL